MRRFLILRKGLAVGEGVEWSADVRHVRGCTYHVSGNTPVTCTLDSLEHFKHGGAHLHGCMIEYLDAEETTTKEPEQKALAV